MEQDIANPIGSGIEHYQQHHAGSDCRAGMDIPGRTHPISQHAGINPGRPWCFAGKLEKKVTVLPIILKTFDKKNKPHAESGWIYRITSII